VPKRSSAVISLALKKSVGKGAGKYKRSSVMGGKDNKEEAKIKEEKVP